MNKRIKELTEQAGFYVADDRIYIPTTSEDITAYHAKFVELIIHECVKIVENKVFESSNRNQHPDSFEAGHDCGMFYAVGMIEQHFGDEE